VCRIALLANFRRLTTLEGMNASAADLPSPGIALSCVICGGEALLVGSLQARLERSARVGPVERLSDALTLEQVLTLRRIDLVVHVMEAPDASLPGCLLAHLDVRVLVITPGEVPGPLSHWLQQGANDVVSRDDEDRLAHALSRLLDECALSTMLSRQKVLIDTQRRRIDVLTRSLVPARIRSPAASTGPAPTGASPSSASDPDPARGDDGRTVGTRDGLPGRRLTLRRLDTLDRRNGTGAPAIAVRLVFPFAERHQSRLERTLCDLVICRAVSAIRHAFPRRRLLGRTRPATLLLVVDAERRGCAGERDVEILLRRALGTLGELLERPEELSIDTLAGPMSTLATRELETRFDQERNAATAVLDATALLQALPVLTLGNGTHGTLDTSTFMPALAAAQS